MVREIVHDPIILARRSAPAAMEDIPAADDLMETLLANKERCVGMAANMIGVSKRIIVFADEGQYGVMLNPEIMRADGPFKTEEGCLSLSGRRETKRYRRIKVKYQDMQLRTRIKTYTGWTAQIIQHEIDHCGGVLI